MDNSALWSCVYLFHTKVSQYIARPRKVPCTWLTIAPGGELIVRHSNKEHVFDWSDRTLEFADHSHKKAKLNDNSEASPGAAAKIQWAAFYSNCEHEVFEVRSGHRLTLTYNLFQTTPQPGRIADNESSSWDVEQSSFCNELGAALRNSEFFENGRVLAAGKSNRCWWAPFVLQSIRITR